MLYFANMTTSFNFLKNHSKIALSYFSIIAFLGVLLRFFTIVDLPINYRFIVHTHSHIALLGWVYTALTTLIFKMYLSKVAINLKYKRLFWATQFIIIGMLITFPFTGYAAFSILFSTLFLLASYVFAHLVFKYTPLTLKKTNSYACIRVALWYMIISSLGPWALGIIMKTAGSGSSLYRNAIYFYLHFQYNGWFILTLLGIGIYILEQYKITFTKKTFNPIFWLMNIGIILTFGISLLWMKPTLIIYIISFIGAFIQLIAFYILVKKINSFKDEFNNKFSHPFRQSIKLIAILFAIKLLFQLVGTIPNIANAISTNVNLIIGYLHWTFLGVVSVSILLFSHQFKLIQLSKKSMLFYLIAFFLTEIIIFYKGVTIWKQLFIISNHSLYLVIVSSIFFIAILIIFLNQFKRQ